MIFVHTIHPFQRMIVVFVLTMIGCFAMAHHNYLIGTGLFLVAAFIVFDTLRMLWSWCKSYVGKS